MPDPQQVKKQRKSCERRESATERSSERRESASEASTRTNSVQLNAENKEKLAKQIPQGDTATKEPKKRGRKLKYTTDEDRKEARRQQNRNYRARRREELIKLRRQSSLLKELKEKSLEQN